MSGVVKFSDLKVAWYEEMTSTVFEGPDWRRTGLKHRRKANQHRGVAMGSKKPEKLFLMHLRFSEISQWPPVPNQSFDRVDRDRFEVPRRWRQEDECRKGMGLIWEHSVVGQATGQCFWHQSWDHDQFCPPQPVLYPPPLLVRWGGVLPDPKQPVF